MLNVLSSLSIYKQAKKSSRFCKEPANDASQATADQRCIY